MKLAPLYDRTRAVYDCMLSHCYDEKADTNYWLYEQKRVNHNDAAFVATRQKFEHSMAVLASSGSTYDPRKSGLRTVLADEERAGRGEAARDAERTWRDYRYADNTVEQWDRILEESARRKAKSWEVQEQKLMKANMLHCASMAAMEARRWALLRWRTTRDVCTSALWWKAQTGRGRFKSWAAAAACDGDRFIKRESI